MVYALFSCLTRGDSNSCLLSDHVLCIKPDRHERSRQSRRERMGSFMIVLLLAFGSFTLYVYNILWLRPEKIRRALRRQGIKGPPPRFFTGNTDEMKRNNLDVFEDRKADGVKHDFWSSVYPYFEQWRMEYGPTFMFSAGNMVTLFVSDPTLMKELCLTTSLDVGLPSFLKEDYGALLGEGVAATSGHVWAIQRKIIAPELFMDKVKGMVDLFVESTFDLLNKWEERISRSGGIAEFDAEPDIDEISADVLSKACFGSSFHKGKHIFSKLADLLVALTTQSSLLGVPGYRYLPIKRNRDIWRINTEIKSLITNLLNERKAASNGNRDLLESILENAENQDVPKNFVVDNCKNIYSAGRDLTASAAKWVLVLLAAHPEWQNKVRVQVNDVCGNHMPNYEMLHKLTSLTMVIQEALRLYPGTPFVYRQVHQTMKLGNLIIPKGTMIWTASLQFHHDPNLWGADVGRFNPERFSHGVSGACKHPHMYVPFGFGPNTCLGQHFAMAQLKIVLALIIRKFKISLSPNYRHSVVVRMMLRPENGIRLLIERV